MKDGLEISMISLRKLGLGTVLIGCVCLASEPRWTAVAATPDGAVDLRMALIPDENGQQQVLLKNFGRMPLHFDYRIMGSQSAKDAESNPRMHLTVKGKAIVLASPKAFGVTVDDVRVGEVDEGDFLKL